MRASDFDRHRAVEELAGAWRAGYLGPDTFESRVAEAFAARSFAQLGLLTADLPAPVTLRRWLVLAFRRFWQPDDPDLLVLHPPPRRSARPFLIGRLPRCSLVLDDPTVSRVHARLVRRGDAWAICDLRSTNGTRVNGWRVEEAVLEQGDELMIGAVRLSFAERTATNGTTARR